MPDQSPYRFKLDKAANPAGISPERLSELTEECCDIIRMCRDQMGLDLGRNDGALSPRGRAGSWAYKRQRARDEFSGDFDHRRSMKGVFAESWWSMNIPGRIVGALSSKLADDLVGSDPFFAAMPENIDDSDKAELAKQVERKVQREITVSNMAAACAQAIRDGLCEGERVVKLTWEVKKTKYPGSGTVLVDKDGKPVLSPSGDYIYKFDDVLDVLVDQYGNFLKSLQAAIKDGSVTMQPGPDGKPVPQIPQGQILQSRLEKEPAFVMPPNPQFALIEDLEITITHKNGLVADVLLTEDFIYDIYQPRLDLCTLMAHSYDAPLEELKATYPGSDYEANLRLVDTGALSAAGNPLWITGEELRDTKVIPLMNVHETYRRCRVNPTDEYESWLFIVLDIVNRVPLFVEYLGRMKMKKPPFFIVRGFESVTTRAYGVGVYEKSQDKSLAIDMFFNRLCLKSGKSGSVTAYHRNAFEETKAGAKLKIGGTEVYAALQADPPWGPNNPPVFRVNLNEVDEYSQELMEKLVGQMELEFGITSSGDASNTDLNSSKTATGIRNIERTGNTVQKATESMQADDITGGMEMAVDMVLENMDPEEAEYTPQEDKLATLNQEEIRMLPRGVRLLLTKTDSSQGIEVAEQVLSTLKDWAACPPALQKQLRPAFLKILKDLDIPDADEMLHDPTDAELKAASDAQANSAKINEQARMMLADFGPLTYEERAQGLARFGIQASPQGDVQNAQQQDAATQAAAKGGIPPMVAPAPQGQAPPIVPQIPPPTQPAGNVAPMQPAQNA